MKIRTRSRELEGMDEGNEMRTGVGERGVRGRKKNRRKTSSRGAGSGGCHRFVSFITGEETKHK